MTAFVLPASVLNSTLGALLIGLAMSAIAYGILTIQVYTYYRRYPSDKGVYKFLVVIIWLLETADEAFIINSVYYYLVTNYSNPLVLITARPAWTLVVQVACGSLVGCIVKTCLSLRVWRFSYRNWYLTGFLVLLTFSQLGLAIVYTVKGFQMSTLFGIASLRVIASCALGIGVATDMAIAASLCYFLQNMRSAYSNNVSDTLVNTLTIYAVNTGVLTSACSLVTLVLYDCLPYTNFVFMTFYFVLTKLYAISFMATMNTRKIIRGRGTEREEIAKSSPFIMVTTTTMRRQDEGVIPLPVLSPVKPDCKKSRLTNSQGSAYSQTPSVPLNNAW